MAWFWLALSSAVLWGFSYAVTDKLLEKHSLFLLLFLQYIVGLLVYGFVYFQQKNINFTVLLKDTSSLWLIGGLLASSLFANVLLLMSIGQKSATATGMVEIIYPLFTALFMFLLFKQSQLSPALALGGALIMVGVFVIYRWS